MRGANGGSQAVWRNSLPAFDHRTATQLRCFERLSILIAGTKILAPEHEHAVQTRRLFSPSAKAAKGNRET
jgi:hypothetical protein